MEHGGIAASQCDRVERVKDAIGKAPVPFTEREKSTLLTFSFELPVKHLSICLAKLSVSTMNCLSLSSSLETWAVFNEDCHVRYFQLRVYKSYF